jgi:hypothetical protein
MAVGLVEDGDRIMVISAFIPRQGYCGLIRRARAEIDHSQLIFPIIAVSCQLNNLRGHGAQYGVDTNAEIV